ncbi:MAG: signal peptidase I [Gammaproteobacteria bacterium]|nr:signal peptidase I [Gammaproteobacteria bacterium]|tara:strand:+ start:2538 stop:3449 length:912 start_codon:yes stop_codon:yes gene_type:complete
MLTDPYFIFGVTGITLCVISWLFFNFSEKSQETFIIKNISFISTISGLSVLVGVFYNAGDLGILLLIGTIISFLIMLMGIFFHNPEVLKTSRGYFIPLLIIFALRTFAFEPFQIPSGSMEPQLKRGDFILVNKSAYGIKVNRIGTPNFSRKDPEYGDLVVLVPPSNPVPYIKRLIGKPGDRIRIINKQIYVNDILLERNRLGSEEIMIRGEPVIADLFLEKHGNNEYVIRTIRDLNKRGPKAWTVPEGHYFVVGDNRDNSNDSRRDAVGVVPRENFFGKAVYLWMTWECWTCIPSFEKVGKID